MEDGRRKKVKEKKTRGKAENGTIKVKLHLRASVMGRDETAVFVGAKTGRRGRKKKKGRKEKSEERRKCEKKGKIAVQRKKGEQPPLAAMGSEFEVDKKRNMGNHR